jgi:hypothetical protein
MKGQLKQFYLKSMYSPHVVFQQDGPPTNCDRFIREFLDLLLPGRSVGRHGQIQWPPRPSDSTPLDFFLCGYVKDMGYKTPVTALDELKRRFIAAIERVTPKMLGGISYMSGKALILKLFRILQYSFYM